MLRRRRRLFVCAAFLWPELSARAVNIFAGVIKGRFFQSPTKSLLNLVQGLHCAWKMRTWPTERGWSFWFAPLCVDSRKIEHYTRKESSLWMAIFTLDLQRVLFNSLIQTMLIMIVKKTSQSFIRIAGLNNKLSRRLCCQQILLKKHPLISWNDNIKVFNVFNESGSRRGKSGRLKSTVKFSSVLCSVSVHNN
jgi:hypothetical protein